MEKFSRLSSTCWVVCTPRHCSLFTTVSTVSTISTQQAAFSRSGSVSPPSAPIPDTPSAVLWEDRENSRDTNHAEEKTKSRPKSFPSSLLSVYSPESITHSTKKPPSPFPSPALSTKSRSNRRRRKSPQQSVLLQRKQGRINVAAGKETF